MLNKEELYQLRERGAVSFGPSSATGAVSLMHRTRGFPLGEMGVQRNHGSTDLPESPLPLPLERVCMSAHVYETVCSSHSKRNT